MEIVNNYSSGDDITFLQTDIYKSYFYCRAASHGIQCRNFQGDADNEKILRNAGFECISYSDYTAILKAQGRQKALEQFTALNNNECIFVRYQPASGKDETGSIYPLLINNTEIPVTVTMTTLDNPISFANSVGTLIVSDSLYKMISEHAAPETKSLKYKRKFHNR